MAGGGASTTTVVSSLNDGVLSAPPPMTSTNTAVKASSSSSSSSSDQFISKKDLEEASRILFAPESSVVQQRHRHHHHHHHPHPHPQQQQQANDSIVAAGGGGGFRAAAAAAVAAAGGGGGAGAVMVDADAEPETGSPLPPPMFRARRPHATSRSTAAGNATVVAADLAAMPSSSSSSASASSLGRLHHKPEVHAEIVRFGMALAANPEIQTVIREQLLESHHISSSSSSLEHGDGGSGYRQEPTVADMESTLRRLMGRGQGMEEGEADFMASLSGSIGSNVSGGSSSAGGLLAGSFELLGMLGEDEEGEEGEDVAENLPSNSFYSLGRNMRRKDSLAGDVSEEVLDELLRSDDDDDVITQKLFAECPDEHIRRYLRNLDLECVICCEYMVEASAVDCGEGHTFCGLCIETWLASGQDGKGRCPTCQKPVQSCIPMRQYDAMIEKYVRASNLWDEQCSFYRRKTLARMRRELQRHEREEAEAAAREAAAGPFAGLSSFFGLGGGRGAAARRRRARSAAGRDAEANGSTTTSSSSSSNSNSSTENHQTRGEGGAGGTAEPWWKSEVLHTALSVATMLVLLVLFRRGVKVR